MKIVKGSLLDYYEGFVCHQVNCMGVMGAGLAKQIRAKYPYAYDIYIQAHKNGKLKLGEAIFAHLSPKFFIVHLCGQHAYGRNGNFTHLGALAKALTTVRKASSGDLPIYLPYGIGCGLAGGNWADVANIIEVNCPEAIVVKYDGKYRNR